MAWVRIDDSFDDNPKLYGASGNAIALWLRGLAWCNRTESDGLIPATMLTRIGDHAPQAARAKVAADLVARRLWHTFGHECHACEQPEPGGWVVHDFLGYQPSSDDLGRQRAFRRERAQLTEALRAEVYERHGYVCAQCGTTDPPFEIDHIVPVSKRGATMHANLQVLCRRCNRHKGNREAASA